MFWFKWGCGVWGLKAVGFLFDSGAVGLFEYSRGVVAFEEGYLQEVREFHKIRKRTGGFGFLNLFPDRLCTVVDGWF